MVEEGKIPKDARAICSRMVLQDQLGEDRKVAGYKARLVGHGFRQREGIDYNETYGPTISVASIWTLLSIVAMENREIVQLDIITAFLESKVEEELYLRWLKEFGLANNGNVILKNNRIELRVSVTVHLNQSLYGLKQAGGNWYNSLESYFTKEM